MNLQKSLKLLMLALIFIGVGACDNEPLEGEFSGSTPNYNPNGPASFTAVVDGASFDASSSASAQIAAGAINITGLIPSTGELITITVSSADTGTYDLSPDTFVNAGVYGMNGGEVFVSVGEGGSGSVTISTLDTDNLLASGTFQFVASKQNPDFSVETVTVTEGVFTNIPLTTDITTGNDADTFTATVDDVNFDLTSVNATALTLMGMTSISISAFSTTNQNIGLNMPADITPGTYDMEAFPLSASSIVGQFNPDFGNNNFQFSSNPGTLTITSNTDSRVEGTFQFTATEIIGQSTDVYEITNGSFSVGY